MIFGLTGGVGGEGHGLEGGEEDLVDEHVEVGMGVLENFEYPNLLIFFLFS